MLDIEKIDRESTKLIRSFTREKLLAWVDTYNKEVAEADEQWARMTPKERMSELFNSNCALAMELALSDGSLNATPKKRAAKPKTSATAQKSATARQRAPKVRA